MRRASILVFVLLLTSCLAPTSSFALKLTGATEFPDASIEKQLKDKGFGVDIPAGQSSHSFKTIVVTKPLPSGGPPAEYGQAYGKIRVLVGSPIVKEDVGVNNIQDVLKSAIGGSSTRTYELTLTLQRGGKDFLKAILASGTDQTSGIFGVQTSSNYKASSTTGGVLLKQILITEANNNIDSTLQLVENDKIVFNQAGADKATAAYKSLSAAKILPLAANATPIAGAALELANLFFPATNDSDSAKTVPLQFIPNDNIEQSHIYTIGSRTLATVSLELDGSLFGADWSESTKKFSSSIDPDLIWTRSVNAPTGKLAADLLRDDLPADAEDPKYVKTFLTDLAGDGLAPWDKLEKVQQDKITVTCTSMYHDLQKYYIIEDSAAIAFGILYHYRDQLHRGGYMSACIGTTLHDAFTRYGLDPAKL